MTAVPCPLCGQPVPIRTSWRTIAHYQHGRPVTRLSVPTILHACRPKETR